MEIRKFVLLLAVLTGFCSLDAQAQTDKKVTSHETIGQRIDAGAKKVGDEVKNAEKVGKERICADAKKVNCKVRHAEKAGKAKLKSDVKKVKRGVAKTEQKVKRAYLKEKAKIKAWEKQKQGKQRSN